MANVKAQKNYIHPRFLTSSLYSRDMLHSVRTMEIKIYHELPAGATWKAATMRQMVAARLGVPVPLVAGCQSELHRIEQRLAKVVAA